MPFPTLDGFGPTRRTLQLYSRALSGLARVHGVAHPNWWHISLRVTPSGLQSDNIPLPGGHMEPYVAPNPDAIEAAVRDVCR